MHIFSSLSRQSLLRELRELREESRFGAPGLATKHSIVGELVVRTHPCLNGPPSTKGDLI